MKTIKTVYCFDSDGYFERISCAQPDPKTGDLLMPPNSTLIEPEIKDGYFAKFDGSKWEYIAKPATAADCVKFGSISHDSHTPHDIELRQLFQSLTEISEDYRVERGDDLSWSVVKKPEKTPEEIESEKKQARIAELKRNLAETDYAIIKIAEGVACKEEYADIIEQRQALRDELNRLGA